MISALKTSGGFLAIPVLLATVSWSDMAFAWVIMLQLPPYFLLVVVCLFLLFISGLIHLKPLSFVSFGLLAAAVFLFLGIWTAPTAAKVDLLYTAKAALMAASTLVPFAIVQFVLALFVSPRASTSEDAI